MVAVQPRPVPELLDAVTAVPHRDANAEDRLLCVDGDHAWTVTLPLSGGLVFGRSAQADVVLADPRASRAHARLTITPTELIVTDLASRHGTLINGVPLVGARAVVSGDVIAIGGARVVVSRRSGPRLSPSCERAHLHDRLADELARAAARGRTVALIALRVDAVAQVGAQATLADRADAGEVTGRLDDGHLAVVAPELDASDAAERGASLAAALDCAVGVAVAPFDGADPASLIAAARSASARAAVGAALTAASTIEVVALGGRRAVLADPAMVELYGLVRRLARVDVPVVIHGETGTGKELVAAALHAMSPRARGPMIALNCAAIPADLAEAELFGHSRGAFTGAVAARPGQLEAASGGTLFLDEIAELSPAMQARLLRVLEAGEVRRLGENQARPIDVRVVCASHQDLRTAVAAGRFRADLLFRLGVARVEVPPLRARPRDLAVLGSALAAAACARMGRRPMTVGASAAWELARRPWPGNVRELRHTIEAAIATAPDDVRELAARHLPPVEAGPDAAVASPSGELAPRAAAPAPAPVVAPAVAARFRPIADELAALERARMVEALQAAAGVQVRAAELLAMPIRTFATKLRRYAIEPEDWGAP